MLVLRLSSSLYILWFITQLLAPVLADSRAGILLRARWMKIRTDFCGVCNMACPRFTNDGFGPVAIDQGDIESFEYASQLAKDVHNGLVR